MNVLHAVILLTGLVLVFGAIVLFAGGLLSNHLGEASASGVYVSFSPQTMGMLVLGGGLLFAAQADWQRNPALNQLPPTAAGIVTQPSPSADAVSESPTSSLSTWIASTSGAFRLEMVSLADHALPLGGSLDLFPLTDNNYQFFLDIHPGVSADIDEVMVGNGRLYAEAGQWYMVFEQGSPAVETLNIPIRVSMEREGRYLVLQFEDGVGREFRQTWRQL